MPIYNVKAPDGKTYKVQGPENADEGALIETLHNYLSTAKAPAPSTERTALEAVTDVPVAALKGLAGMAQFPGQVYGLATGDFDTAAMRYPQKAQDFAESLKSKGLKAREERQNAIIAEAAKNGVISEGVAAVASTIKDPALFASFIAEQVPQLLPALLTGGAYTALSTGTRQLAKYGTKEAAEAAAKAGAAKVAIGTGIAQQGADVGADTYKEALDLAEKQYPGMSLEDRQALALSKARATAGEAGIISLLAQRLPGGAAIERRMAGLPGEGRIRSALGEAASELVEEGGGKFASNVNLQQIDPTRSLTQGVGQAAGLGAIGGGVLGGAIGRGTPAVPLQPGQRAGESLEQTTIRLQQEILNAQAAINNLQQNTTDPSVQYARANNELIALATQPLAIANQIQTVQAAQEAAAPPIQTAVEPSVAPEAPTAPVVEPTAPVVEPTAPTTTTAPEVPGNVSNVSTVNEFTQPTQKEQDATKPVAQPSGGSPAATVESVENAPAPSVGGVDRSGVVPAGQDVGVPVSGEGTPPAAVTPTETTLKAPVAPAEAPVNAPEKVALNIEAQALLDKVDQAIEISKTPEAPASHTFTFEGKSVRVPGTEPALLKFKNTGLAKEFPNAFQAAKPPAQPAQPAAQPDVKDTITQMIDDGDVDNAVTYAEANNFNFDEAFKNDKPRLSEVQSYRKARESLRQKTEATPEAPKETREELEQQKAENTKQIEAELVEAKKQLTQVLKTILTRMGLKDVSVKLIEDINSAEEGSYADRLMRIAVDANNPLRVLKHETIHALKELGFFTDSQWKSLVSQANSKWIDQYLKNRTQEYNGKQMSRYDAYMVKYNGNMDMIVEEAIADAFGDFSVKAPPGMLAAITARMKMLFQGIKSALNGTGFYTSDQIAEQIFTKAAKGQLKAKTAPATKDEPKSSLRIIDMTERRTRQLLEEEEAESREMQNNMQGWQRQRDLTDLKDKINPWLKENMNAADKAKRIYNNIGDMPGMPYVDISLALERFNNIANYAYTGVFGDQNLYGAPTGDSASVATRDANYLVDNKGEEISETINAYLQEADKYRKTLSNKSPSQRALKQSLSEIFDNVVAGKFTKQTTPEKLSLRAPKTEAFKDWFADSKIINKDGTPTVVYHGTKKDFSVFETKYPDGLFFFSTNPAFASKWPVGTGGKGDLREPPAGTEQEYKNIRKTEDSLYSKYMKPSDDYNFDTEEGVKQFDADRAALKAAVKKETGYSSAIEFEQNAGVNVMPVYLSIQKPFDPRTDYSKIEKFLAKEGKQNLVDKEYHKSGNWVIYEDKGVIDELKRQGYDGIWLAENIGGPHETIAAFSNTQVKSATGNDGTYSKTNPDIRYSLRTIPDTKEFKQWSRDKPVIRYEETDEYKGGAAVFQAFHGTTHTNIETFDVYKGNKDGALGAGSYLTTSPEDASKNYAGIGPDLTARIAREEESLSESFYDDAYNASEMLNDYFQDNKIDNEVTDDNFDELKDKYGEKAIHHAAQKALKGDSEGLVMPMYVRMLKPFDMRPDGLILDYSYKTDDQGDPIAGSEQGALIDFLEAARNVLSTYNPNEEFTSSLLENGADGISAKEIFDIATKTLSDNYDDNGDIISSGHIIQEIAREAGYDGLIQDANSYFGTGRRGFGGLRVPSMAGVHEGVLHLMPFKDSQLKSAIGNKGTYSEKGNIKFSLRNKTVNLNGRDIPVVLHGLDKKRGEVLVPVNTKAFDDAWEASDKYKSFYIGPKGTGNAIKDRYERFADFSVTAKNIEASSVSVDEDGNVGFGDGRHRWSFMRDQGVPVIPVAMSPESLKNAEKFGYVAKSGNKTKFSLRSKWSDERIDSLINQYSYLQNGREGDTKAYATLVKPSDFLNATATKEYRKELEKERTSLDVKKLAKQSQPIYLDVQKDEEGVYQIVGHEGRHRMMALRDAGVDTGVPVVLNIRPSEAVKNAVIVDEPYFKPQKFGDGSAPKGFFTQEMIPISWKHKDDIKDAFGGEAEVKFSLRSTFPQSTQASIDRIATAREDKGFIARMMEAIAPTAFSTYRQQYLNRYNQLGKYDKMLADLLGVPGLLADASSEAAALQSDLGAGLTASALGVHDRVGGIPVFRNGITVISNVNGTVGGPMQIFAKLTELGKGDPYIYQSYQFWAGAKRASRFNAQGVDTPYTAADLQEAQRLEAMYPEFKQIQKDYIKFNDGLVQYMLDTGIISEENAKKFSEHADYIPFYRQLDGEETIGPNIFQSISGVKPPKKIKGGEAPLADFMETIVRNTQSIIQAGVKNTAAQRAVNVAMQLGPNFIKPLNYASSLPSDIMILENGLKKYYRSSDPLWIESLKALNAADLPFNALISGPANLLRTMVTKDPGFMLANMMRDSLAAYTTSGIKMVPIVDTIKNFTGAIAGKSFEFQALLNAGILGGHEFSQNIEYSGKVLSKELRKKTGTTTTTEKVLSPFTGLWSALEKGTTASDAATRMEVYKKTLAETGNEAEALFRALEVMNFNRKGSSPVIRVITAAIPFLNARIQGLDVLYRAGFGEINSANAAQVQRSFFIRGAQMMALSAMYWALTHDDDEYKKQEAETRDNYWLLPSLGIKIPIPFEIGILFKVIPERILAYSFGDDTGQDFMKSMARQLMSTLAVNPIPQTALPIFEAVTNHSFFTQRPIVGQGLEGVEPGYQVGPGTTNIAADIGKALNISPMKLDHMIKGYSGTMGMYLMDIVDSVYSMNSDIEKPSKRLDQMPVLKRFMIDPEARGTVTAYYEMKNAADQAVRTSNLLERTFKFNDRAEYLQENGKMLVAEEYVKTLEKTMKQFREMRLMVRSSNMSGDDKQNALNQITAAENKLTSNIQAMKKALQ
jgi:hypothetical protein